MHLELQLDKPSIIPSYPIHVQCSGNQVEEHRYWPAGTVDHLPAFRERQLNRLNNILDVLSANIKVWQELQLTASYPMLPGFCVNSEIHYGSCCSAGRCWTNKWPTLITKPKQVSINPPGNLIETGICKFGSRHVWLKLYFK